MSHVAPGAWQFTPQPGPAAEHVLALDPTQSWQPCVSLSKWSEQYSQVQNMLPPEVKERCVVYLFFFYIWRDKMQ